MTECLLGLGSNLGDRLATLDSAIRALQATHGVQLLRHTRWQQTRPVGGPAEQGEFLNGAAVVDASVSAQTLRRRLQTIEEQAGRQRRERWEPRTLDLDLLLYDRQVINTPQLTVPHPRMSFRRFVLEPACEIAGEMVHPLLEATLADLLQQLEQGADVAVVCGESEPEREELCGRLCERFSDGMCWQGHAAGEFLAALSALDSRRISQMLILPPADEETAHTAAGAAAPSSEARQLPKLVIYLPPAPDRLQPGVPSLVLEGKSSQADIEDASAAIEAVWPRLAAR